MSTALSLIQATVEPGAHTLESLGFKRKKNRPGEDSYEWGRINPNGASISVLFVNTSPHIPTNPPDFHYALLGSDYRTPRLGAGGHVGFLQVLKSELIQAAKTSPTWADFRDTVRSKHCQHYESLSNRLCEEFWTRYHGNNVVATVEPGQSGHLKEFPKLESALTKLFGRPQDVTKDDETEMQFGIPGVPSKPGGLVASVYVYTVHESLNINVWLMGCLYRASIDHESRNPSRDVESIVTRLRELKALAGSPEFKLLVAKAAAGAPVSGITRFGHKHRFSSFVDSAVRDAMAELKTGRQAAAMRAWAQ